MADGFDRGLRRREAEVIEKARKLKSIKTTLALGETASIDGADYS